MCKTQKHTPLPWKANQSELDAHSCRVEIRGPGDAYSICTDTGWANAEFIVLACNSHYDLLEACKKAVHFLRPLAIEDMDTHLESESVCNGLQAAIAKATT